jgi:hypothetical protein
LPGGQERETCRLGKLLEDEQDDICKHDGTSRVVRQKRTLRYPHLNPEGTVFANKTEKPRTNSRYFNTVLNTFIYTTNYKIRYLLANNI